MSLSACIIPVLPPLLPCSPASPLLAVTTHPLLSKELPYKRLYKQEVTLAGIRAERYQRGVPYIITVTGIFDTS